MLQSRESSKTARKLPEIVGNLKMPFSIAITAILETIKHPKLQNTSITQIFTDLLQINPHTLYIFCVDYVNYRSILL